MKYAQWLRVVLAAVLMSLASGLTQAAPQVGWWWNPNESGRGFFIESRDDLIYIAGYFYDDDGRATWAVAGGPNRDAYHYDGRLLTYQHGQTLYGDYVAPSGPTDVGSIRIQFSDDTHGTITWPGGTIPIEREIFDTGAAEFQPANGWWWNPDESGAGYSVEVQGDTLFIVAFMYDNSGNPIWYYSAGKMTSPTNYLGTLRRFANGQTLRGPYQPAAKSVALGTLSIKFTAHDEAMLTMTDDVAVLAKRATKPTRSRQTFMKREFATPGNLAQPFAAQAFVFPNQLIGYVEATTRSETKGDSVMLWTTSGMDTRNAIIWEPDRAAGSSSSAGGVRQQTYYPTQGTLQLDASYRDRSEVRNCDLAEDDFTRIRTIPGDIHPDDLKESLRLVLRADGTYEFGTNANLYLHFEGSSLNCKEADGSLVVATHAMDFAILAQKQTGTIERGFPHRYEMHGTWTASDAVDQYRITWDIFTPAAIDAPVPPSLSRQ